MRLSDAQNERGRQRSRKRYCLRGHDTYEVGRHKDGGCRQCLRERSRVNTPAKRQREKDKQAAAKKSLPDLCWRGHPAVKGQRCQVCLAMTAEERQAYNELWDAPEDVPVPWKYIIHEIRFFESIGMSMDIGQVVARFGVSVKTAERICQRLAQK